MSALAQHRRGFHRGVDLVTGAVEEAGVDEHHAVLCRANRFLEDVRRILGWCAAIPRDPYGRSHR
jgi:hypothetical protein